MSDRGQTRRRGATWLAVVAGLVAVAALVRLMVVHPWAVVAVPLLTALAVGSGWAALTRRGRGRRLAIAGAALALAAGVAGLLAADALLDLIVLLATCAVAVGASRAARRNPARATAPATRAQVVRAGRPVLLLNPRSGGGKVERFHLVEEARRRGIDTVVLGPRDDLAALAAEAVRSATAIGMAGGDGSQALVAGIAAAAGVPYVCVPAGTRNHFALDLGLSPDDVAGSLDAFADRLERRVDLASVAGRTFVNNVSLGLYAEIVQSDDYRAAKLGTAQRRLPELLSAHPEGDDLRFRGPDGKLRRTAHVVLVSNNPYRLAELSSAGTRTSVNAGVLGIVALEIPSPVQAAIAVSLEAVGQLRRFEGWLEWTAEAFEVDSSAPVPAGIDGEAVVLAPPLRFATEPGALRLWLPASVAARPAATRRPAASAASARRGARAAR